MHSTIAGARSDGELRRGIPGFLARANKLASRDPEVRTTGLGGRESFTASELESAHASRNHSLGHSMRKATRYPPSAPIQPTRAHSTREQLGILTSPSSAPIQPTRAHSSLRPLGLTRRFVHSGSLVAERPRQESSRAISFSLRGPCVIVPRVGSSRPWLLIILTVSALTYPLVLHAEPSAADKSQARELAEEGLKKLEAKSYVDALQLLKKADALYPAPTIELGIGRAEVALKKYVAAEDAFNQVIHTTLSATASSEFKAAVVEAQAELDQLMPLIPSVTIHVHGATSPTVILDGETLPTAALGSSRPIDPGVHKLKVTATGFVPVERSFTIVEGTASSQPQDIDMKPAPTVAPLPSTSASAGAHESSATPSATASSPRGSWVAPVGFTATVLGVIGLGIGGVAGAIAVGDHSSLTSKCPMGVCPASEQGALNGFHGAANLSTVGLIVGGVLTGGGVVLLLTHHSSATTGWLSPMVGLGSLGVVGGF